MKLSDQFTMMGDSIDLRRKYWIGRENFFIRQVTFLRSGLDLLNEAKNYILMLFGAYWTVRSMDWWLKTGLSELWLLMFIGIGCVIGLVVLLLVGRWNMFRADKARSYISQQHASPTQYQGHNMQVVSVQLLEEILNQLKKK